MPAPLKIRFSARILDIISDLVTILSDHCYRLFFLFLGGTKIMKFSNISKFAFYIKIKRLFSCEKYEFV